MIKIYLAGRFSRGYELLKYAEELEKLGYEITSSWLHEPANMLHREIAIADVKDVLRCDWLLNFTEPHGSSNIGGGRHVEFGIALASGKGLFVVGEREVVFHHYPRVYQVSSFAEWKHIYGQKTASRN